jgi:hypothetical protein
MSVIFQTERSRSSCLRTRQGDPDLIRRVWEALNRVTPEQMLCEGRVYGGGLHKLEPRELANVAVPEIAQFFAYAERPTKQQELFIA